MRGFKYKEYNKALTINNRSGDLLEFCVDRDGEKVFDGWQQVMLKSLYTEVFKCKSKQNLNNLKQFIQTYKIIGTGGISLDQFIERYKIRNDEFYVSLPLISKYEDILTTSGKTTDEMILTRYLTEYIIILNETEIYTIGLVKTYFQKMNLGTRAMTMLICWHLNNKTLLGIPIPRDIIRIIYDIITQ